ncbi:MAG: hypothetical protein KDA24_14940 [Deltaproteobacteria bacterium]|nr:hypothetical protein [Deltaproteobacteria bacterium]
MTPRSALLHPATAVGFLLLLPIVGAAGARWDVVGLCLVWLAFTRLWTERWFGRARPDVPEDAPASGRLRRLRELTAGALAVVGGGVAIAFLRGWDLWFALLFLPLPVLVADSASSRLNFRLHRSFAALPILTVVLCLLTTVGGYSRFGGPGSPALKDDFLYPLRAVEVPEPLSEADRSAAIDIVRRTLTGKPGGPQPSGRLADPHPYRVWVTVFRDTKRRRWVRGVGEPGWTLAEQLVAAADAARKEGTRSRFAGWNDVRIQIDLEGPAKRLRFRWFRRVITQAGIAIAGDRFVWRFAQYDLETGVDGFRLRVDDKDATVLPADPMLDGWFTPRSLKKRFRFNNWQRTAEELARRAGVEDGDPWPPGAVLDRMRTYSFAQPDPTSPRTVELFRGNVLFDGDLDEARLLRALSDAGEWLLGTVEDDGRFDYEYFPTKDRHGNGYNEVRHAGSVYGLFHLANLAADEASLAPRRDAYIDAGIRALDRVYGMLGRPVGTSQDDGYVAFVQKKRKGLRADTGAQALTLLSFLARPAPESVDDPQLAARLWREGDEKVMAGLAKTLMALIDDRGWVYRRWSDKDAPEPMEKQPLYYPGELMLALVMYHQRTGDPAALEAAKVVGRAQIAYAKRPWQIPDHWVMQALDGLDALDPEDTTWRDAAYDMGNEYTSEQFVYPHQRGHAPDYRGAYRRDMEIARTTRAASRGEAVGGVARIAYRRGDPSERWERSLIEGARHLIEQMYTPDNSFTFPNPDEGIGAIRMGLIDNHCRIDNNQHGIVALDAALVALRRQGQ